MKKFYLVKLFYLFITIFLFQQAHAQCPVGWTGGTATVKWDNRFYLITTGNYAYSAVLGTGVTAAMSSSQNFTIGTNFVNITFAGGISTTGRNTSNTGTTGSFGSGYAVQYANNGTITLTFDTVAANVQFSLYDIDNSQSATVTATDASGTALNITMANASGAGTATITGSGSTSAKAAGAAGNVATSSNTGTVNVTVNGFLPAGTNGVKKIIITMAGTAGDYWLSDISACIYSPFPGSTYYNIAKPYTGQNAYIIANSNDNTASAVDLSTGKAKFIMKDNGFTPANKWLNSFAYDAYNHYLYYVYDESIAAPSTTPGSNRSLKMYDFNNLSGNNATMTSGIKSTVLADVTLTPTFIPIFDQGMETGAACFNDGSLYIGIEGGNLYAKISGSYSTSGRYSMIWRIDFDASNNPRSASQVFAAQADDGAGNVLHNWGDISVNNGILYDFDGASGANANFTHYNLTTGLITANYVEGNALIPGQSGVSWNGTIYRLHSLKDSLAVYNLNGFIGPDTYITPVGAGDWTVSGSGDASDAFLPPLDYGDAPATYDPSGTDPAVHDYDSLLKLGTYWNAEFAKKTSSTAAGEGVTDDGVPSPPIFTHHQTFYNLNVKVYNHTGGSVTIAAWVDFNNDGVFQASEGITKTLATSSTSLQNVNMAWAGEPTIPSSATNVFLRVRVAPTAAGMTTASMNGYLSSGEVEDYSLLVDDVLGSKLVSFNATGNTDGNVAVSWTVNAETNMKPYEVQRSADGINWTTIQPVESRNDATADQTYNFTDASPLVGHAFYRLKMENYAGMVNYSQVIKVETGTSQFGIGQVNPNPFDGYVQATVFARNNGTYYINIFDAFGKLVHQESVKVMKGENLVNINRLETLAQGIYILEVSDGQNSERTRLVKK